MGMALTYVIAAVGALGLVAQTIKGFLDKLPDVIESWQRVQEAWRKTKTGRGREGE